jgi:hypothetical protein
LERMKGEWMWGERMRRERVEMAGYLRL